MAANLALTAPLLKVGDDLLAKVREWCVADHDDGDFDATEDAEEVIQYLKALARSSQISIDLAPSAEAMKDLLQAQGREDLADATRCVENILAQLESFLDQHRPKGRGRPKGSTTKKRRGRPKGSTALSKRPDGKRLKQKRKELFVPKATPS